jgi:hypothetical protein
MYYSSMRLLAFQRELPQPKVSVMLDIPSCALNDALLQEVEYIEQVGPVKWTVKQGFVPGMRVPGEAGQLRDQSLCIDSHRW